MRIINKKLIKYDASFYKLEDLKRETIYSFKNNFGK